MQPRPRARIRGPWPVGFLLYLLFTEVGGVRAAPTAPDSLRWNGERIALFPATHARDPGLPSPYRSPDGTVTLTARLVDGRVAVVAVTLTPEQRVVDAADFPALAHTGLHDEKALADTRTITGRSVAEITSLGRPGRLSASGFLADDEDILSVLVADNRLVERLGLTHRALAEPLSYVMNLVATDIGVVWANHSFDGLAGFSYNGMEIRIKGTATKGGQQSIFADGIEGALDLDIWRELTGTEKRFLKKAYRSLPEDRFTALVDGLSRIHTGEMEPQYITRYGFYEGHTEYRTDPLAIAVIFGLTTLEKIEAAFPGRLPQVLTEHYTRDRVRPAGSGGDAAPSRRLRNE
jgi:hypothetical protein